MTNYQRKHFRETQEPHGKQSEEEEEEEEEEEGRTELSQKEKQHQDESLFVKRRHTNPFSKHRTKRV